MVATKVTSVTVRKTQAELDKLETQARTELNNKETCDLGILKERTGHRVSTKIAFHVVQYENQIQEIEGHLPHVFSDPSSASKRTLHRSPALGQRTGY
jgi:hypothetical protein